MDQDQTLFLLEIVDGGNLEDPQGHARTTLKTCKKKVTPQVNLLIPENLLPQVDLLDPADLPLQVSPLAPVNLHLQNVLHKDNLLSLQKKSWRITHVLQTGLKPYLNTEVIEEAPLLIFPMIHGAIVVIRGPESLEILGETAVTVDTATKAMMPLDMEEGIKMATTIMTITNR